MLAEAAGALIAQHNQLASMSTAACLRLDLSSSAFLIQGFPSFNIEGGEDSMAATPPEVEAGYLIGPKHPASV